MDIAIRKAEPSDAEAIWKCYTAPLVVRNTLQLPYRSLESVRELLTKGIELTVFTDNEPAIALYRKFGFEIEGTHRKFAFRDGEFVDSYVMARVK